MSTHNHPVAQEIYDQLNLNKTILRKNLGDSVDLLRQNNVPMRNFVLKLIETFMEFPENECMVMKADDDVVCGIVMINAAQKAMYARWSECLLFD
ncbi:hypothetical protein BBJ28_00024329 [Nothophytophthora sp. Chile5]|nr:hypothetical protein BBJ28_00024329 [Nothophytophthora sp. Chile5]